MAEEVRANAQAFARILNQEQGKPFPQALAEVNNAVGRLEYDAGWARRVEGEIIPSDSPRENLMLFKEPLGVVSCILPWNFPFYVMVRKLAPALVTGNTVILKPSSETPNLTLEFGQVIQKLCLPKGVVNIVTGKGSVVGAELCSNPLVNMVTFTGSTEGGQEVMRAAADSVAKVSLELGGKAPAVVMNDADLELAVTCVVGGRIRNAGQVCNSVERVYVQEGIAEKFTARVIDRMRKLTIGNGAVEPFPEMGPMINHNAKESVHSDVEHAKAQGAKLALGGKIPSQFAKGSYYEPTVLTDCSQDMQIMHKEIFGPVMPIMIFRDVEQVLELANDCEYGLTSTLYTSSFKTAMEFANNIEAGELYVNRQQGEAYAGFHAGWKKSGIGGDDGKHGMEEFLQTRTVYMKY
jgi:lactaldehyde dehydrogenase/glycolaldehyde dehydrogenase